MAIPGTNRPPAAYWPLKSNLQKSAMSGALAEQTDARRPRSFSSRLLRLGFWVCIVIAVAAVLRRLVAMAHPSQTDPAQMAALNTVFASHAMLTLAHIIPALAFVLLAPVVLLRRPGPGWPRRALFPLGVVVGATAYGMSFYAIGGWIERSAVLFFDTLFLYCLARAYRFTRQGESPQELRWLWRAVVILLGIATTRPVMGAFFATSRLTHLEPSQFFGIAFWIGFSINTLAIELWMRRHPVSWPKP